MGTKVAQFENHFELVEKPARLKKVTGTRLGKVLNVNHWSSPFQAWCEINKVAEPPFEGNQYTEAGQVIEQVLIDYAKESVSPYILNPEEYFGKGPKKYDFYPNEPIYGGMWDALAFAESGHHVGDGCAPIAVIECKTTSRPQDWEFGVPEHYKVQGMLYAHLLGIEDVYFPVAFLTQENYDDPYSFECDETNTRIYHVSVNDPIGAFPNIVSALQYADAWYENHVKSGESPKFDEKKDKEYLDIIRQANVLDLDVDVDDLETLCTKLAEMDDLIAAFEADETYARLKKERSKLNSEIQKLVKPAISQVDGVDSTEVGGYIFKLSLTKKCDYVKMEEDGVTERYVTLSERITTKRK